MFTNIENLKKYTLLYVEDEETIRTNVVSCLEYIFNVVVAKDGKEGVEKFNSSEIDLIITDLNMPNKDGLSMLKEIKEISPLIPTIVTSAYDEEVKDNLQSLGITKLLKKPFNVKDLIANSIEMLTIK
ncbi:response regulator [Halarcobacter ebronensis]|uniref:Response regulator n=1 Tax=Halarcobacter ebronensis TaxID=1462615 RepID=A0A4Q1AGU9_9BACT|nr:response regulator [Halarcobacter ebronensis]QKF81409.1 two-component system response regulator [Halarcobacter ebronensis]RXK01831.1 response regulator [Halarcobacter ebronensis]